MVFYIEPEPGGSGRSKPRDPRIERLQKLENANFVTGELGRFSKSLDDEFARRASAGGARSASFSEDLKHLGLDLIEDTVGGIETLPNGRPRIDGTGRAAFRSRARDLLALKLDEAKTLQGRQAERDALGMLSSVGQELSEVAGRRPNDFAALRENLSRAVDDFAGVFEPARETAIRRELEDDLVIAKLKGMAASDLGGALAELDDPANLPEHGDEEREELASQLRNMAAASRKAREWAKTVQRTGEGRERMAAAARLDAALGAAETEGSIEAVGQAHAALNAAADGGLSQARFDAALARLGEQEAALAARADRIARIETLLAEGGTPDASDPGERLAVDEHFAFYRESLGGLSEPERFLAQAVYAGRVGMMPALLAEEIERGLLAKAPDAQVDAAKRFAFVEQQLPKPCPEGVMHIVPCTRARGLAELDRIGVLPERAVALTDLLFRPGGEQGEVPTRPFETGEDEAREALRLAQMPVFPGTVLGPAGLPPPVGVSTPEVEKAAQALENLIAEQLRRPDHPLQVLRAIAGLLGSLLEDASEDGEGTGEPSPLIVADDTPTPQLPGGPSDEERRERAENSKLPGFEPVDPESLPDIPGFPIPDEPGWVIEEFPVVEDPTPLIIERRGNEDTRMLNEWVTNRIRRIVSKLGLGLDHIGGSRTPEGVEVSETHLKNSETGGLQGGSFLDITFQHKKTKRRLFLNTYDTRADGTTPTTREMNAAIRIVRNMENGDILLLIPKLRNGETLDLDALDEFLTPYLEEITRPKPDFDPRQNADPSEFIHRMIL